MNTPTPAQQDNGGPAFPKIVTDTYQDDNNNTYGVMSSVGGMSLLDYLAGQALAGAAQCGYSAEYCAEYAYAVARAMLAHRKATGGASQ